MDDITTDAEAVEPRPSPAEEEAGPIGSRLDVNNKEQSFIAHLELEPRLSRSEYITDVEPTHVSLGVDDESHPLILNLEVIPRISESITQNKTIHSRSGLDVKPPSLAEQAIRIQSDVEVKMNSVPPIRREFEQITLSSAEQTEPLPAQSHTDVESILIPPDTQREPRKSVPHEDIVRYPAIPPDPPLEFRFNSLLIDIAERIDEKELNIVKTLFRGREGIGKRTLERCDTCLKLFGVLRNYTYLSRDNITYLNYKDSLHAGTTGSVISRAVQYCRDEGNVVHYYSNTEESETGEAIVTFHIVTNVRNTEWIDRLRNNVARIVCAPVELVRIATVEPGSSLLVSLIMPKLYADILQRLLQNKADLWELRELQVDIVRIEAKSYDLTACDETDIVETEQQRKLQNIYHQLATLRHTLDNTEKDCEQKMENMQVELERLRAENHSLETTLQNTLSYFLFGIGNLMYNTVHRYKPIRS